MDREQPTLPEPPHQQRDSPRRSQRTETIEAAITSAGVAGLAGTAAGLIWGGVGGRVAMRIVFLTSDDRVMGLTSDDGFEIGRFSAGTIFLLIFTSILGAIAGLIYGSMRMLLTGPRWLIAIGVGVTAAAAGGAAFVSADGIDFRVLEPLWVAVGLFVLIPGAWGVTVVVLTERLLQPGVLYKTLPAQIDNRYWGTLGGSAAWLLLVALTALGLTDLVQDLTRLT